MTEYWQDGKGGPAACAVHDPDPAVFEQALGIARGVLPLVEGLFRDGWSGAPRSGPEPSPESEEIGRTLPVAWLDTLAPGADTSEVPVRMIVWMLTDPQSGSVAAATDNGVRNHLRAIASAHLASLDGDPPSALAWSALRRQAVEMTDGLPPLSADAKAATTMESAAWPGDRRGSVALDTYMAFMNEGTATAAAEVGWTLEHQALQDRLDRDLLLVWETARKDLVGEARETAGREAQSAYQAQRERDHPDLIKLNLAYRNAANRVRWARLEVVRAGFFDLLRRAPILTD